LIRQEDTGNIFMTQMNPDKLYDHRHRRRRCRHHHHHHQNYCCLNNAIFFLSFCNIFKLSSRLLYNWPFG
jgi:hypothetical protein